MQVVFGEINSVRSRSKNQRFMLLIVAQNNCKVSNMINPVAVLLVFRVEAFVNRKVLIQHLHQFNIR